MNSGQVIDIGQHQAAINYVKFIPEHGNTLVSSAYENQIHFWSLNSPKPIQTTTYSAKIFKTSLNKLKRNKYKKLQLHCIMPLLISNRIKE